MTTTVTIDSNITNLLDIGPLMKNIRELKGLTVGFVSDRSELNWNSVNLFEKNPGTISSIKRVANALEVTIHAFIKNGETETREVRLDDLQTIINETIELTQITQTELARMSGLTIQGIKSFRTSSNPTVRTIQSLLESLNYELSFTFEVEGLNVPTSGEGDDRRVDFSANSRENERNTDFGVEIGSALTKLREDAGLDKVSLSRTSGVSPQSIMIAEKRGRGFNNFYKIAEALNKELTVFIKTENEEIEVAISELPKTLDKIRVGRGISAYKFSKMANMTHRSVTIFANSTNSPAKNVERYAAALGVTVGFKIADANNEANISA